MTDMEIQKKIDGLKGNAEFEKKVQAAGSNEEIRAILKDYDIELTDEQFAEVMKVAENAKDEELDEAALENVAGGVIIDSFAIPLGIALAVAIVKATRKKK